MAKKDAKATKPESETKEKPEKQTDGKESKKQTQHKPAAKSSGGVSCIKTCFLLFTLAILGLVGKFANTIQLISP